MSDEEPDSLEELEAELKKEKPDITRLHAALEELERIRKGEDDEPDDPQLYPVLKPKPQPTIKPKPAAAVKEPE